MEACYGKLIIVGKDGTKAMDMEFPLDKKTVLIGRDKTCDIRIVNKEISRRHAEIYQEDGKVFVSSLGREPILVNGAPVHSPLQLYPSDKIEVQLEGRTRIFYFQPVETPDTINARAPLIDVNNADLSTKQQLVKPSPPVRPVPDPDVEEDIHPAEQACGVIMQEEEQKEEEEEKQPEPHTTPEGAVADATYHFPSNNNHVDMANAVAVNADTTMAFGQWAMETENDALQEGGDMDDAGPVVVVIDRLTPVIPLFTNKNNNFKGEEEKEEEEKSDDGSPQVPMHPPLSSIKPHTSSAHLRQQQQQTPAAGVLFSGFKPTPMGGGGSSSMQGRRHTFSSVATPGTEFRPAAPAPTPATAFQVFNNNNNMYDPEGLAEKLNHHIAGGGGEGSTPRMPAHNAAAAAAAAATPGCSRLGFKPVSACKPPVSEAKSRSATIQSAEEEQQQKQQQEAIAQPAMMVSNSAAGVEVMQPLSFLVHHLPVPHTAGRSRLAMQGTIMDGGDNVDEDGNGTAEVVEMEGTAEANGNADVSPSSLAVVAVMEEDNGTAEEGETSAEKATVPELYNNGPSPLSVAVPPPPPPSASHHQNSRCRSSMRTPGTKIVIIERDSSVKMKTGGDDNGNNGNNSCPQPPPSLPPHSSNGNTANNSNNNNNVYTNRSSNNNNNNRLSRQFDQATPGSVKPLAMASRLGGLMQSNNKKLSAALNNNGSGSVLKMKSHDDDDDEKMGGHEDEEMEISLAPMAAQVHQEESPLEKMEGEVDQMLATVEKPAQYTVVEQERMDTVEREKKEEGQQQKQQEEMGMIPLAQYKSMVLKARAYRTESLQLANALHKMTAKALRLKKSANALGDALNKETKKRVEVQNVLQQIVENREEEEEDDDIEEEELVEEEEEEGEGEMMDVDEEEEEDAGVTHTTTSTTRVIVVGHVSAPPLSNTIRAGQVVVVRPYMPQQPPVAAAAKTPRTNTKSKAVTGSVVPPVNNNTIACGASTGRKRKSSVSFAAASVAPGGGGGGTATGGKRRLLTTPGSVMISSNNAAAAAIVGDNKVNNQKKGTTPLKVDNVELPGWLYTEQKEPTPEIARHLQMVAAEKISADDDNGDDGDESEEKKEREMSPEILGSQPLGVESEEEDEEEEDMCHVCGESDEGDVLLLCDDCDNACHLGCCNPPLKRVPKGNWYCVECKAAVKEEEEKNKGAKRGGGGGKKAAATQPAAGVGKKAAVVAGKRGASASVVEDEAPKAKRGRGASATAPTRSTRSAGRR